MVVVGEFYVVVVGGGCELVFLFDCVEVCEMCWLIGFL